jgi:hypothetical protein
MSYYFELRYCYSKYTIYRVPSMSLHGVILLERRLRLTRVLSNEQGVFFIENVSRRLTQLSTY